MKKTFYEGPIVVTSRGGGYFTPEGAKESLVIAPEDLGLALHGDTVRVEQISPTSARVTDVLARVKTHFVGTIREEHGIYLVIADDGRIHVPFEIPKDEARVGWKALVELGEWTRPTKNPRARVEKLIGKAGEHNTEMIAIVLDSGFPYTFPSQVEEEAAHVKRTIGPDEISRRRDFRGIATFTIDPEDAKDFDDALSIRRLADSTYEIGIHIADVTHYVQPKSAMDKEAAKRATSIYLVDRTIPMLPEVISNDVCSLRPNEDRLAFSTVLIMTNDGNVQDRWIGKTVIHSQKRFTYEEAQGVLDTKQGQFAEELSWLAIIAKSLQKKNAAAGAIAFHTDEVKFKLDDEGRPIEIRPKPVLETNKLIEQFMLLSNREVAEYIERLSHAGRKTFVYRVHDEPPPEKISRVAALARQFGHALAMKKDTVSSHEVNRLISAVAERPEQNLIHFSLLRSMAKAVYSIKNIGHYGLAFSHYTHFTSPIRRYPDMMVHRLLEGYLTSKPSPDPEFYEAASRHASEMEIKASDAERTSIRYKHAEYMSRRIGAVYDGVVTGVNKYGLYAQITETKSEGMVRVRDMGDDFYDFDENQLALVGRRTGKRYQLGDAVRVRIKNTDLQRRLIDLVLA